MFDLDTVYTTGSKSSTVILTVYNSGTIINCFSKSVSHSEILSLFAPDNVNHLIAQCLIPGFVFRKKKISSK